MNTKHGYSPNEHEELTGNLFSGGGGDNVFIVNFGGSGSVNTVEQTFDEILAAAMAGKYVIGCWKRSTGVHYYHPMSIENSIAWFCKIDTMDNVSASYTLIKIYKSGDQTIIGSEYVAHDFSEQTSGETSEE